MDHSSSSESHPDDCPRIFQDLPAQATAERTVNSNNPKKKRVKKDNDEKAVSKPPSFRGVRMRQWAYHFPRPASANPKDIQAAAAAAAAVAVDIEVETSLPSPAMTAIADDAFSDLPDLLLDVNHKLDGFWDSLPYEEPFFTGSY
ncbi:hypothetical protein YC2023_047187 [Brassica napus]